MHLGSVRSMPVGILLDPLTKYESRAALALLTLTDNRGRAHFVTNEVNRVLQERGIKPMGASDICRARKEFIRREWLIPSRLTQGVYFLNPRLFPPKNEDSQWHHKLCQEWDEGLRAYQLEHPKGTWAPAFGDVEGL